MKFAALDFEKANKYSHSICSVGLVVFEDNKIIEEKQMLIQPPNNNYGDVEISIHKITPELTKESPTFIEVWEELYLYHVRWLFLWVQ